ncbi:hypothetical protein BKI52_03365 [marine bacterium AO1-C]|nr:hypothetical protein BKI52_03365 [marine bacterium AO1-C]
MKKLRYYLIVFNLLFYISTYAQNQLKIDSLKQTLNTNLTPQNKVDVLNQLARLHRHTAPGQLAKYAHKALILSQKHNYSKGLAEAYANTAIEVSIKGDYPSAIELFNKTLKEARKANHLSGQAIAYKGLGVMHRRLGNKALSLQHYQKSLDIYISQKDTLGMASCYNNMANVYRSQGFYLKAIKFLQISIKLKKAIGYQRGVANSFDSLGSLYESQHNYLKAMEYYQRSLNIMKKVGSKRDLTVIYMNIGSLYEKTGHPLKATRLLDQALNLAKKLPSKHLYSETLYKSGLLALSQKQYPEAKQFFKKSLAVKINLKEETGIAENKIALARLAYIQKQYKLGLDYLTEAMNIGLNTQAPVVIKDAAKNLAKIHESQGSYKKAYQYHLLFKKMADSLYNTGIAKKTALLEANYQFEKEKDSIKLARVQERILFEADKKRRKSNQKATYIGLGLVSLLLLMFVIFYFDKQRSNRKLNRVNTSLQEQSHEIITQRDAIEKQNNVLKHANHQISQSILAAKMIQEAILPKPHKMDALFTDHFVLNRPRDVVSGDFYWVDQVNQQTVLILADCTGHGVPGAFMCMISYALFNQIIKLQQITNPAQILEHLRKELEQALESDNSQHHGGLDASVVNLQPSSATETNVTFAGAKLRLWYATHDDGKLATLPASRISIGMEYKKQHAFKTEQTTLPNGSMLFMSSDGYIDQNNAHDKRLGSQAFQSLLCKNWQKPLDSQRAILEQHLGEHMQNEKQRDDILVLGIKL